MLENDYIVPTMIDAEPFADTYMQWMSSEEMERQAQVRLYREYYYGEHGAKLTKRQEVYLNASGEDIVANYSSITVNSLARRLRIKGFSTNNSDGESEYEKNKRLEFIWRKEGMASKSSVLAKASVRDGDAYLVVDYDKGRPRFTVATAYDGHGGMSVQYDVNNRDIDFAIKRWAVQSGQTVKRRMDIYREDRIERYISDPKTAKGKWVGYTQDGQPAVIPWLDANGSPIGCPVFHFPYNAVDTPYGMSVLNDFIPVQMAINKTLADLLAVVDSSGFATYWMLGQQAKDADGNPLQIAPGSWVSTDTHPDDIQIGRFEPSHVTPVVDALNQLKLTAAQVTETPIGQFQIQGQSASEGALKQQGVGLSSRIEETANAYETVWERVLLFALKLDSVFGESDEYSDDMVVDIHWDDFDVRGREERTELQSVALSTLISSGVDPETAYKIVVGGFSSVSVTDFEQKLPLVWSGANDNQQSGSDTASSSN